MPPKPKINKEMILNAILEITKIDGFHAVNARSIADRLQCSTRPIFTCYENMSELKSDFKLFAQSILNGYLSNIKRHDLQALGLATIKFAQCESNLYKFLFVDSAGTNHRNFYDDIDNAFVATSLSENLSITEQKARSLYLKVTLIIQGACLMIATNQFDFSERQASDLLRESINSFVLQAKMGF